MAAPKYCVILHAGTTECWETSPSRQQEIEQTLHNIAKSAGSRLASGAKALDVVQFVVSALGDCPLFNAGKGAVLNEDGKHELEAAIAEGASGAYGAVACVRKVKNPILAARAVLEHGRHTFLIGPAADEFAQTSGVEMVPNDYFTTDMRKTHWEKRVDKASVASEDLETVGAVALDLQGHLAAAGSTGGLTCKMNGRLGDTAVMGAGLYVDENIAVVCSGTGEDILRHSIASKVAALKQTMPLDDAVTQAIINKSEKNPSPCAIIAINSTGQASIQSSGRVFLTASHTSSYSEASVIGATIPLLSQHTFHRDTLVSVGLTRYPITPGHTVVTCHRTNELMSLSLHEFLTVLNTARQFASAVSSAMQANRCGLVCDGRGLISLIPLHGLTKEWNPVVHDVEEYHATFPGYLTSKNGPKMADSFLDEIRARINTMTGITEPFNNHFDGDSSDQNIFARIIRGELPQWRIWEDDSHVAFLTPFGNTPGYTVLVPRKHLCSDILGVEDQEYADIVRAAHTVAQHLKAAFSVRRCGMFFEGYEIEYAHVKLIPVHDQESFHGRSFTAVPGPGSFHKTYEGYLTSQFGPRASNFNALSEEATKIRELIEPQPRIIAPKTWQQPSTHSLQAVHSPWYTAMLTLQDTLFHTTIGFFHHQQGYKYALVPQTTDSISSPMGLGSDSVPVRIPLHGEDTYLADSKQFTLEYILRLEEGLKGAYYVGCSFRGEDHDQMHLNQFYHIECELLGTLDTGIDVAEQYIITVASALLEKHQDIIYAIACSTSHITTLLSQPRSNAGKFARITLTEALALPEMISTPKAWKYAVENDHSKGRALTRIGELILIKMFNGAVWLTEMDHFSVPFYQAFVPSSHNSKALCADLLLGPGEILGLGQRHVDAETVRQALKMHQVPEESYEWYMGIRDEKLGGDAMQTTGWGMGMERFLSWILQHDDIRDLAIIPRLKTAKFLP